MFKSGPVTSCHRTMFTSQNHTKTQNLSHSLRPPLPNLNNPCSCWPLPYTLHSASQKQTSPCKHSGFRALIWHEDAFRALERCIAHDCVHLWQWNRMECPHCKAYQSFIADSRLCNVFIAQGSFLRREQVLGDSLFKHTCVYRERCHVFQDLDRVHVCEQESALI